MESKQSLVQRYTLYLKDDRILARNAKGKLIDLGEATRDTQGNYAYQLDTDEIAGQGFNGASSLLEDVGSKMTFLYLDELFTSLPDRLDQVETMHLAECPSVEIAVDEMEEGAAVGNTRSDTPLRF